MSARSITPAGLNRSCRTTHVTQDNQNAPGVGVDDLDRVTLSIVDDVTGRVARARWQMFSTIPDKTDDICLALAQTRARITPGHDARRRHVPWSMSFQCPAPGFG